MATDAIGRRSTPSDRERFPDVKDRIGEDPARFLDIALEDTTGTLSARIRGIDFVDVLDEWVQVEAALDRGPRRKVMARLNQRKNWLQERGERPDRAGRAS